MTTPSTLVLPSLLDMSAAETFHKQLLAALSPGAQWQLQGKEVERITTACIQLIIAFMRGVESEGGACCVAGASAVLSGAFADLGLAAELETRSIAA